MVSKTFHFETTPNDNSSWDGAAGNMIDSIPTTKKNDALTGGAPFMYQFFVSHFLALIVDHFFYEPLFEKTNRLI